jgi:hypothetical protein
MLGRSYLRQCFDYVLTEMIDREESMGLWEGVPRMGREVRMTYERPRQLPGTIDP